MVCDMNKNYQVFISYRRDGGETLGRMLYDRLTEMGYSVFYDVESLRSGPFNKELFDVIDGCTDVLVVLPPGGLDRCDDPKDWVRAEIAYALKSQKNVIPIMMRGFQFDEEKMPDDIRPLANLNGIEANMELFPAVMEKLTKKLMKSKPGTYRRYETVDGDEYVLPRRKRNILELMIIAFFLFPLLIKLFYVEQAFLPEWLNRYLLSCKDSAWWKYVLLYIFMFAICHKLFNSSFMIKRNLFARGVLELADFELSIDDFIALLTDMKALEDLQIFSSADISEKEGYKWAAERLGLKIRSYSGETPDYLLLNYQEYTSDTIEPLYLNTAVTKNSAGEFMQAQGFSLEWQRDKKACYKNGEWKVFLFFGGFAGGLLVIELMRGEKPSLFDQTAEKAAKHTFSGEMKQQFDEMKKEGKDLKSEIKQVLEEEKNKKD